jgi:hypothetical protein
MKSAIFIIAAYILADVVVMTFFFCTSYINRHAPKI